MDELAASLVADLDWPQDLMKPQPSVLHSWWDVVSDTGVKPSVEIYKKYIKNIKRVKLVDSEDAFLELHPPRCKADLSIRRSRYMDIYNYIIKQDLNDSILRTINGYQYDYITTCNLFLAYSFFGDRWFRRWEGICTFADDIEWMSSVMDKISNKVKLIGCNVDGWQSLLENKCLTGYRQLPFPGFSMADECRKLANGGIKHKWSANRPLFRKAIREILLKDVVIPTNKMGFKDYIASNIWARSGSSSMGKLTLTFDGKEVKIELKSGSVMIWGGLNRMLRHAVLRIDIYTCPSDFPFKNARINFTLRYAPSISGREGEWKTHDPY